MTWQSFDNMDEMFSQLAANEAAANARVTEAQRAIKPGDYVARIVQYPMEKPILIIGHTFTLGETRERESKYTPDPGELDEAMAGVADRTARGYLFGEWYSVISRDGELGDTHISQLHTTLSQDLFEQLLAVIQQGEDPIDLLS